MHIGFSLLDLAMGGAQTWMVQLASGLAGRGHQISYYVAASREDTLHMEPSLLAEINLQAQAVSSPWKLLVCDVIQLDGYHSLLRKLTYILALGRCIETYHSLYSLRRSGPLYTRHRVAVSEAIQLAAGLDVHVIPNGIPLQLPALFEPRLFDLCILGRIHPVKQHLLFLQTCEILYRHRGALSVLIVGGHSGESAYQQQVDKEIERLRAAGLEIHTTGNIPPPEVPSWLAQARLLLVTSENEGFGRMAIEGLACGLPVIANPVGGLLEIVQEGLNGYFAKQNDSASFASLSALLLDDVRQRQEMGLRGRELVERRFSFQAMLDAYEQLYQMIAARQVR